MAVPGGSGWQGPIYPRGGGKGGKKGESGKVGGKFYEYWKMFLGHIHRHVEQHALRSFITFSTGMEPVAVHMSPCRPRVAVDRDGNEVEVGLNSAFVEFATPRRM